MVFHWSLSDSKSLQVSRTLLSILAVLKNVVWMDSTRLPTIKSYSSLNNPVVTVPKAPITIGIIVTFMFHSFFNSLARSRYLFFFSISFSFILWSAGTAKYTILQVLCCYHYYHYYLLIRVFASALADGLSLEFEWLQVSRTLLSILAVFNNSVVWMVSTRPPTSKSSGPFNKPLVTVPKAPITIGTIVTFMFHSFLFFFNSLARSRYLSLISYSFSFILWSAGAAKSTILKIFFFFVVVDYFKIKSFARD